MKILYVEDDVNIARMLQITLDQQRYQIDLAYDGQAGWDLAEVYTYDLILLNAKLPKLDGISFCKKLRGNVYSKFHPNRDTPIILMTASNTTVNKVIALDAGADDYLVKPVNIDELLAIIRALLRRSQVQKTTLLTWGNLCLNLHSCEVTHRGQIIYLAAKEYELLELFLRNPEQVFSSSRLLERLWKADKYPSEGTVRTHIKGLRQKLKQVGVIDFLETIYKQGYRLKYREAVVEDSQEDMITSASVEAKLDDVWEKYRHSYSDRLLIIEQAITALRQGEITQLQRFEAEKEAHTLIGSLGSFGLDIASQICRQIQQLFKREATLTTEEIHQMDQLIKGLQEQIEQYSYKNQLESFSSVSTIPNTSLLIVDDDLPLAKQIATEAINWGFLAEIAVNLPQAQKLLIDHADKFDVILLDVNFPDSRENGLDFLAMLHSDYPEIPILILTVEDSFARRVQAARLGSQYFLAKPIFPSEVLATAIQVIQKANQSLARLLIVDDDPALLEFLRQPLELSGYHVILLEQPDKFWETMDQTVPDLLILDIEFSLSPFDRQSEKGVADTWSGFDLCQVVRSDTRWNRLPVLFISAHTDNETIQRGFTVGADDFLTKPIQPRELITRVRTRLEQRKLWKMMEIDPLTGVSTRRKALQDLVRTLYLAQRRQQHFTLGMLELDHIKCIKDEFGYERSDRVLNYFGKLLNQLCRQEDVVGRWGSEEFLIGMYSTDIQEGMQRLGQILHQLTQHSFTAQNGKEFRVTFSAGIAQVANNSRDVQALYQKADTALYQAKILGRNRICAAKLGELEK